MKKLLFLIFPLAFFIGFMPYFFNSEETQMTSTMPKLIEKEEKDEKEHFANEIQEHIDNEIELLLINNGIVENATILHNSGIENI